MRRTIAPKLSQARSRRAKPDPTEDTANECSTVADRQGQGPLQSGRHGIQKDGLLRARLRAQGHRHYRVLPSHASRGRRPDRSFGGGRRRVVNRDLDGRLDRSPHGNRKISRQVLPRRPGSRNGRAIFRPYRLRSRSLRAGLDRQSLRLHHRQRLWLQALEGAQTRGHAPARGLREDVPGAGDRDRRRARAARQVWQAAARRDGQAKARALGPQLWTRRLRGAQGRPRLHQGRREHQLAALHALARPLSLLHGGGQQGGGRDRRDQGHAISTSLRRRWRICTSAPSSPRSLARSSS